MDIFLWNCRGDLLGNSYEGCTTFVVPGRKSSLIGHNEDGDPFFKGHVFMAEIKPDEGIGFTSFYTPALCQDTHLLYPMLDWSKP